MYSVCFNYVTFFSCLSRLCKMYNIPFIFYFLLIGNEKFNTKLKWCEKKRNIYAIRGNQTHDP